MLAYFFSFLAVLAIASSFKLPSNIRNVRNSQRLSVVVDESYAGILPPTGFVHISLLNGLQSQFSIMFTYSFPSLLSLTGFFDPLGLAAALDEPTLKKYRESELKHGRIAMLAALGIPVAEG